MTGKRDTSLLIAAMAGLVPSYLLPFMETGRPPKKAKSCPLCNDEHSQRGDYCCREHCFEHRAQLSAKQ